MRVKETNKIDIESKFRDMGDFMKMDYLLSSLKNRLDYDTKKFVLVKLSGLYELKKMFNEAAKMMISAAEINVTFQNKINDFVKASELSVRGGDYASSENSMKKALALASENQMKEIKNSVKEFYKTQARVLIENDKRKSAVELYENFLRMGLKDEWEIEVREKLLELYDKLGMIKEYKRFGKQVK
jgi:tetratricopeptide (TPR) repeat protein